MKIVSSFKSAIKLCLFIDVLNNKAKYIILLNLRY